MLGPALTYSNTKPNHIRVSSHAAALRDDSPKPPVPSRLLPGPPPPLPPPRRLAVAVLLSPIVQTLSLSQNGRCETVNQSAVCQTPGQLYAAGLFRRNSSKVLEPSDKISCDDKDDSGRESDDTFEGSDRAELLPAGTSLLSNSVVVIGTKRTTIKFWTDSYY